MDIYISFDFSRPVMQTEGRCSRAAKERKGDVMRKRRIFGYAAILMSLLTFTPGTCTTAPGPPTLTSPTNGVVNLCPLTGMYFAWTEPTTGDPVLSYTIQVTTFTDTSYLNPIIHDWNVPIKAYTASSTTLLANTAYRWRVRGINYGGDGSWAEATFTTGTCIGTPGPPTLTSPTNGASNVCPLTGLDFYWTTPATGEVPFSYTVQVTLQDDEGFSNPVINILGLNSIAYTAISSTLLANSFYKWRVKATNSAGDGPWTAAFLFETGYCQCINRLNNGDFEYWFSPTDPNNWAEYMLGSSSVNRDTDSQAGIYAARLDVDGNGSLVEISQDLYLDESISFQLQFYSKISDNSSSPIIKFSIMNTSDNTYLQENGTWSINAYSFGSVLSASWTPSALGFISDTASSYRITFSRGENTADKSIFLDNATLVLNTPPTTPTLTFPSNGTTNFCPLSNITFDWLDSTGTLGFSYQMQLSTSDTFSTLVINQSDIIISQYTHSMTLSPSTTYYWRVRAMNCVETSEWSETWSFTTAESCTSGSTLLYIPYVINTSSFRSNIQIINVGTMPTMATVRLYDSFGIVIATKETETVNMGGYLQINQVIPWLGSSATNGYLEIESSQPIVTTGQYINNSNNDPSTMVGKKFEEATDGLISVSVAGIGTWKSSLVVINLGENSANIDFNEYDPTTGALLATKTTSIPARGYFYSNEIVAYMGLTNTYGLLTVRSTNGQPLLVSTRVYSISQYGGYFDGQKVADAETTNALPYAIYNSQFRSNVQIINVGTFPTTATIYALDSNGNNIVPPKTTSSIPVNGYLQINNVLQWMGASSGSSDYVKVVSNSAEKIITTGQFINNTSSDPSTMVGRRLNEAGDILSVSVVGSSTWKSTLSIINMGTNTANITLKEFDISGVLLATKDITIPANAIWYSNDIVAYMGLTNTYGFFEIISTNGEPVIAATRVYSGNYGGFFNGQNIESVT